MPAAFVTSVLLHGLVVAVLLLAAYSKSFESKPATKIFELVAGEGDNFAATEAPALGSPGGIKLSVPTPPIPRPEPVAPEVTNPEPVPEKPIPPPPVPKPPIPVAPPVPKQEPVKSPTEPKPTTSKTKTMAEQMRWEAIRSESKIKTQIARDKAAEKKRLEQEAKVAKAAAASAPRVDVEGIVKGVQGGSTANKEGGAGGKALVRSDGPVMEAYFGMLRDRLLKALDKPPGLSDTLVAEAEFRIGADGSIRGAKIISPSGSAEFDRAVLEAYSRVRMPARPDGKSSVQTARFRTKDLDGG
jgi:colicin import membrane protein